MKGSNKRDSIEGRREKRKMSQVKGIMDEERNGRRERVAKERYGGESKEGRKVELKREARSQGEMGRISKEGGREMEVGFK